MPLSPFPINQLPRTFNLYWAQRLTSSYLHRVGEVQFTLNSGHQDATVVPPNWSICTIHLDKYRSAGYVPFCRPQRNFFLIRSRCGVTSVKHQILNLETPSLIKIEPQNFEILVECRNFYDKRMVVKRTELPELKLNSIFPRPGRIHVIFMLIVQSETQQ